MDGWMDLGWSRSTHLSLRYLWAQVRKSSSNSKESDRTLTWVHIQQDNEHAWLWGENCYCQGKEMYWWTSKRRELDHLSCRVTAYIATVSAIDTQRYFHAGGLSWINKQIYTWVDTRTEYNCWIKEFSDSMKTPIIPVRENNQINTITYTITSPLKTHLN